MRSKVVIFLTTLFSMYFFFGGISFAKGRDIPQEIQELRNQAIKDAQERNNLLKTDDWTWAQMNVLTGSSVDKMRETYETSYKLSQAGALLAIAATKAAEEFYKSGHPETAAKYVDKAKSIQGLSQQAYNNAKAELDLAREHANTRRTVDVATTAGQIALGVATAGASVAWQLGSELLLNAAELGMDYYTNEPLLGKSAAGKEFWNSAGINALTTAVPYAGKVIKQAMKKSALTPRLTKDLHLDLKQKVSAAKDDTLTADKQAMKQSAKLEEFEKVELPQMKSEINQLKQEITDYKKVAVETNKEAAKVGEEVKMWEKKAAKADKEVKDFKVEIKGLTETAEDMRMQGEEMLKKAVNSGNMKQIKEAKEIINEANAFEKSAKVTSARLEKAQEGLDKINLEKVKVEQKAATLEHKAASSNKIAEYKQAEVDVKEKSVDSKKAIETEEMKQATVRLEQAKENLAKEKGRLETREKVGDTIMESLEESVEYLAKGLMSKTGDGSEIDAKTSLEIEMMDDLIANAEKDIKKDIKSLQKGVEIVVVDEKGKPIPEKKVTEEEINQELNRMYGVDKEQKAKEAASGEAEKTPEQRGLEARWVITKETDAQRQAREKEEAEAFEEKLDTAKLHYALTKQAREAEEAEAAKEAAQVAQDKAMLEHREAFTAEKEKFTEFKPQPLSEFKPPSVPKLEPGQFLSPSGEVVSPVFQPGQIWDPATGEVHEFKPGQLWSPGGGGLLGTPGSGSAVDFVLGPLASSPGGSNWLGEYNQGYHNRGIPGGRIVEKSGDIIFTDLNYDGIHERIKKLSPNVKVTVPGLDLEAMFGEEQVKKWVTSNILEKKVEYQDGREMLSMTERPRLIKQIVGARQEVENSVNELHGAKKLLEEVVARYTSIAKARDDAYRSYSTNRPLQQYDSTLGADVLSGAYAEAGKAYWKNMYETYERLEVETKKAGNEIYVLGQWIRYLEELVQDNMDSIRRNEAELLVDVKKASEQALGAMDELSKAINEAWLARIDFSSDYGTAIPRQINDLLHEMGEEDKRRAGEQD